MIYIGLQVSLGHRCEEAYRGLGMQLGWAEAWYEYRISVQELVPGRGGG